MESHECTIEHVFYGGEIINCEKCSKLQHSEGEGQQCPTDLMIYGSRCSKTYVSEENEERCSLSPPSQTLSSPVSPDKSKNIECSKEHIRYGGEIISCSSCCNLRPSYSELSEAVKGRRASSTPPSSSSIYANNSKSLDQTP